MKRIAFVALALAAACAKPAGRPDTVKRGELAPDVKVGKFLRGDLKELKGWADLKGKAVVIEFWGTYCEPCKENIPHMNGLAEKFKGKPVVFLSLSREKEQVVADFLKTSDLKGNVAAEAADAFKSFSVRGIPHTVLLDKDSRVLSITYPSRVTEETINSLLAGTLKGTGETETETASAASAPSAPETARSFFSLAPSTGGPSMSYSDSDVKVGGLALSQVIGMAVRGTHGLEFKGVPDEVLSARYELSAKVDMTADDAPARLRGLVVAGLNGALPLRVAVVKKNRKVWLLRKDGAAKPGLQPFQGKGYSLSNSREKDSAEMSARGGHMYELAEQLEEWLGEPVLDDTGLGAKQFVFSLKISPLNAKAAGAALARELGLKLVESRRDVDVTEVTGLKKAAGKS